MDKLSEYKYKSKKKISIKYFYKKHTINAARIRVINTNISKNESQNKYNNKNDLRIKKEKKAIKELVLEISKIHISLSIFLVLLISVFNFTYGCVFLSGAIIALVNFPINAFFINKGFNSRKVKGSKFIIELSYMFRMTVIVGLGFLYRMNYKSLIFYMVGFISYQLSMFIYSKNKELKGRLFKINY